MKKSLYGLKQAPREWFLEVQGYLKKRGFEASNIDPNLFIGNRVYVLLFVDNMLIIGKRAKVDIAKALICQKWKCKDLAEAKLFVGFYIERDRRAKSLRIHQSLYIAQLLKRFKMDQANLSNLPIPIGTVLKRAHEAETLEADELLIDIEKHAYQQIVRCLIYLSNYTRLDLCYVAGQLARHMAQPQTSHLRYAKQAL